MTSCPPIDNITIFRDEFGRLNLPLHPDGGMTGFGGQLNILPAGSSRYVPLDPEITITGFTSADFRNMYYAYKKEGPLVTLSFKYVKKVAGLLAGTWDFVLPFPAAPSGAARYNLVAQYNGTLLDFGIGYYRRMPVIRSRTVGPNQVFDRLRFTIVDGTTDASTVTPIPVWAVGDTFSFMAQYLVKEV